MTLDEAQKAFEADFKEVVEGTPYAWAQNGRRYGTMTVGGVKAEGSPHKSANTEQEAIDLWLKESRAEHRRQGSEPILFWRCTPEIECLRGRWRIFSRMAFGVGRARDAHDPQDRPRRVGHA